ncbi:MAG TPA: hypothetical protein VNZ52_06700 [Candidatus Thermoplasmatota archaeon]|nr:hypothetical protein [Candidatus Thermoplasmatota archaeon]
MASSRFLALASILVLFAGCTSAPVPEAGLGAAEDERTLGAGLSEGATGAAVAYENRTTSATTTTGIVVATETFVIERQSLEVPKGDLEAADLVVTWNATVGAAEKLTIWVERQSGLEVERLAEATGESPLRIPLNATLIEAGPKSIEVSGISSREGLEAAVLIEIRFTLNAMARVTPDAGQ